LGTEAIIRPYRHGRKELQREIARKVKERCRRIVPQERKAYQIPRKDRGKRRRGDSAARKEGDGGVFPSNERLDRKRMFSAREEV